MIRIKLCKQCGESYEVDDADPDLEVCGECSPFDEDNYGLVDFTEWSDD